MIYYCKMRIYVIQHFQRELCLQHRVTVATISTIMLHIAFLSTYSLQHTTLNLSHDPERLKVQSATCLLLNSHMYIIQLMWQIADTQPPTRAEVVCNDLCNNTLNILCAIESKISLLLKYTITFQWTVRLSQTCRLIIACLLQKSQTVIYDRKNSY
jgi:hypothetical protein